MPYLQFYYPWTYSGRVVFHWPLRGSSRALSGRVVVLNFLCSWSLIRLCSGNGFIMPISKWTQQGVFQWSPWSSSRALPEQLHWSARLNARESTWQCFKTGNFMSIWNWRGIRAFSTGRPGAVPEHCQSNCTGLLDWMFVNQLNNF